MKIRILIFLFFLIGRSPLNAIGRIIYQNNDTLNFTTAKEYNEKAYKLRLRDPQKALEFGKRAESIAVKIKSLSQIAESRRVIGIAYSYLNEKDSAINKYLESLSLYQAIGNELGEAKVSNNIGNIMLNIDYEKSLGYYKRTIKIALKHNDTDLVAGSYLNIGNAYYKNKQYSMAMENYQKSRQIFSQSNNPIGITQSLQNIGVIYYRLNELDSAKTFLLLANNNAKRHSLNSSVAGIDLTLSSLYMKQNDLSKAEQYINEGLGFAELIGDQKRKIEFRYTQYELEKKRKNFETALDYLQEVYVADSASYKKNLASNILLVQQTLKQQQTQKENELTIQSQRNAKKLSLAIGIVAVLSFFVIFLLIKSNKRSKQSNQQLQELNDEIITQKNKVDRINHQLEELIAERTKDLIIKNQKLSEYSSHLSHQIRGPVATLKGLMMLVEENMVQSNEIAPQIKKCVDDIDTKIMDINDALNDPTKKGLS